jgi:hypothetical protein
LLSRHLLAICTWVQYKQENLLEVSTTQQIHSAPEVLGIARKYREDDENMVYGMSTNM